MNHADILELAQATAKRLGIRVENTALVLKNMKPRVGIATILCNKNYTLWVDRHYVAYADNSKPEIVYVFADEDHISEELRSVCKRITNEKSDYALKTLMSAKEQLLLAEANMSKSGDGRFIFDRME